jgi:hypothetical protein
VVRQLIKVGACDDAKPLSSWPGSKREKKEGRRSHNPHMDRLKPLSFRFLIKTEKY